MNWYIVMDDMESLFPEVIFLPVNIPERSSQISQKKNLSLLVNYVLTVDMNY